MAHGMVRGHACLKKFIDPRLEKEPASRGPVRWLPPAACPVAAPEAGAVPFSRRKPCTCLIRLTVVPRMELIRACIESTDAVADARSAAAAASAASASDTSSGNLTGAPSLLRLWPRVA